MASFTDQIPQFSPYISRAPIMEAMATVGMYKQAKYDEGVQKIQSYVDNVAGLDVYNPISKKYLESKVNELSGRLRTVAAGDFSNQQLVNSIGGMASEIIKDPDIQNAVYSAANVKNQTRAMEAAKAKGEWGVENEDLFNEQLSKYYNSTDLKDRFTTQYVPYIDMYDKFADFAEKFGYDKTTTQQLWNQREDGSYILDKNGNRTWNNLMLTKTVKAKDAAKMLNAFQASLNPRELQQLAITGRYVNKNKTVEDLSKEITDNYAEQKNFAETNLEKIKLALFEEESKNKKDADKIQQLAEQYQYYGSALTGIEKSVKTQIEDLPKNLEGAKVSLYTNKWLHNVAKGLADAAGKEIENKYDVNPIFTVTMELNKFNETKRSNTVQEGLAAQRIQVDRENAKADREYKQAELFYKYGVGDAPGGMAPRALPEPLDPEEDGGQSLVSAVNTRYDDNVKDLNTLNLKLTTQWVKTGNPRKPNESEQQYNSRVAGIIRKVAGSSETNPNSGSINEFTAKFASKQLNEWKTKKNAPVQFRGLLAKQDDLIKDISVMKGQMESAEREAVAMAKAQGLDAVTLSEARGKIKPAVINLPDGRKMNLSKDDIIDLVEAHPERFNTFGSVFMDKEQEVKKGQALNRLRLKYGENFNTLLTFIQTQKMGMLGPTAAFIPEIENAAELINNRKFKTTTKFLADVYKDKGMIKQPVSVAVQRGKENKDDVNSRLSSIVDKFRDVIPNEAEMQAAILEEGSAVKFKIHPEMSGGIKYEMIVTSKKTGAKYTLPVDEESYSYMMGKPFTNVPTPRVVSQLNSYGSSNLQEGSSDPSTAWFGASDFSNLSNVNYTATGDLISDELDPNKLWFKLYLHKGDGSVEPLHYPKPLYKLNSDGTVNQSLDHVSAGINKAVIEQIKNN